ncbi:MAG: murein biosynthesis integral membrane protein MurJ [Marmoricola sp.]
MTTPMASPGGQSPAASGSVLSSSAVMAAGTVVSRLSGFVRGALLASALGIQLHADVFNIANTIPNMLYILLAGGVFNAVLVPQLVRSMKSDADGGEAYTNRVVTLAALFLAGVTAVLVIAAPLVMRIFLSGAFDSAALAGQRDSAIAFARYCLPQVFFYGMFVLVGQILNARGSFGPMMWAPIANNVISVAVLGAYLAVFGGAVDVCRDPGLHPAAHNSVLGPFSGGQEALLGLGSTLGIAAQLLILLPYLHKAGFRFSPRFDFRGSGLGHTARLGVWTVLFVIVNQIALAVVIRIAGSSTAAAAGGCDNSGATGYTVYSSAFLLVMVPHAIATVSLATVMLPRLSAYAAEHDLGALGRGISSTIRTSYALIVPFALLLPVIAIDLANVAYGYGGAGDAFTLFGPTLSLFAIGLVFFTSHYLVLRGFYALERTRLVFGIQCVVSVVNIALAWGLTRGTDPSQTSPRLVLAYSGAYAVGAVVSFAVLSRLVGGLQERQLVRFLVRLLIAAGIAAGAGWLGRYGVHHLLAGDGKAVALLALAVTGLVDLVVFGLLARLLRIAEVNEVLGLLGRRLPRVGGRR